MESQETHRETMGWCPICQESNQIEKIDFFPAEDLRSEYLRQFQCDICNEFPSGLPGFDLCQCESCGMQFFNPLLSGTSVFYSRLSEQASYYSKSRWEFDVALKFVDKGKAVVDVGCGDGYFLSLLPRTSTMGIEFNPEAVQKAQSRGLNVLQSSLEQLDGNSADLLTLFQVMEHVIAPMEVLSQAIRVLRPGGRLLITVPNNDGWMGTSFQEPLNAPPHHPLRWTRRALEFLPRRLPLKLETIEDEPLAGEHLFHYRKSAMLNSIQKCLRWKAPRMKKSRSTVLLRKALHSMVLLSLKVAPGMPKKSGGRPFLNGGLPPPMNLGYGRIACSNHS